MEQETNAEKHGSPELNFAAPHRPDPVENLDPGGNSNDHRSGRKESVSVRGHPDCKHVVSPDAHAYEPDGDSGTHHHWISEDGLAGKNRNNFGSKREARNNQDINFRVTENPEEVHPQHGGSASLRVEEVATEEAID